MKKWIAMGIIIAAALNLRAQPPEMFRYQGRLVSGTNLVNATLPMSFKLYDAQTTGNLLYEDSNSVLVVDGLYSTYIGDNTVFGTLTNALTNAIVYLEITINSETLSPRERLVSVPYALNTPVPITGDPVAVTREAVNGRWTRNTYTNGDITMSDRDTGLMWSYKANLFSSTNWYNAQSFCSNLTYAGYSDWQLPSMSRLAEMFFATELFTNIQLSAYWSGTSYTDDNSALAIEFDDQDVMSLDKSTGGWFGAAYVWPVRIPR